MRKNINRLTYTMQFKFAQAWKISQKKGFSTNTKHVQSLVVYKSINRTELICIYKGVDEYYTADQALQPLSIFLNFTCTWSKTCRRFSERLGVEIFVGFFKKSQSSPCFGFSVEAENPFKSLFCSFKPLTRFSVSRLLTR
jgi:hypothetical protein